MQPTINILPPEVREQIFKLCLVWDGKTPDLIKAARQNKAMHDEVMAVFLKMKPVKLMNKLNEWKLGNMSEYALSTIKKLKIEVEVLGLSRTIGIQIAQEAVGIRTVLRSVPNVDSLHLEIKPCPKVPAYHYVYFVDDFVVGLKTLKKLTVALPKETTPRNYEHFIEYGVLRANIMLGAKAKLVAKGPNSSWRNQVFELQAWTWKAEKDAFLNEIKPRHALSATH